MTWRDRLTVNRDGQWVRKRYALDDATDAATVAKDASRYYDRLVASGLAVVDTKRVDAQDGTVTVVQQFVNRPTLAQEIRTAVESERFTDAEVARLVLARFEDVHELLDSVDVVSEDRHSLFGGFRFEVGSYWQPAAMFGLADDTLELAKLLSPLLLDADTGLPDFDGIPPDVRLPPELAYYLWFSPIGAVHNLCESLLSLVAFDLTDAAYESVKSALKTRFGEHLEELGVERSVVELLELRGYAETYTPITRLLDRYDEPGVRELVEVAQSGRRISQ